MANRTGVGQLVVDIRVRTGSSAAQITKTGTAIKALRRSLVQVRRGFAEFRYGIQNLISGIRPAMFAGTIAAFGGLREAVKFDQEVATLGGVLGDLAAVTPKMRRSIKELALDPRNNATVIEAAQAYTALNRAGLRGAEALRAASVALRLSSVDTALSVEKSGKSLPKMADMFGVTIEEIGDAMSRMADKIPGNVSDIETAMQFGGPAIKQFGLDVHEGMALVGIAISRLRPSITGTTVRRFLSVFGDKKKAATLEKVIGKGSIFTKAGGLKAPAEIFTKIGKAFTTLSDKDRLRAIKEIFGLRGQAQVSALGQEMLKAGDAWDQWVAKSKTGADLTKKSEQVMQGLARRIKQVRTALGVIAVDFVGQLFGGQEAGTVADNFTAIAIAFGRITEGAKTGNLITEGFSKQQVDAAFGIQQAVIGVKEAFSEVGSVMSTIMGFFGEDSTAGIAKTTAMFVALAPVALGVMFALSSVLSVIRGLALVVMGLGRVLWMGLIKPLIFSSKWIWRFLSGTASMHLETTKFGQSISNLRTRLSAFHDTQATVYRQTKALHGTFAAGTTVAANYAAAGIRQVGKAFFSLAAPIAAFELAFRGIEALFNQAGDAALEAKRRFQSLRSGRAFGAPLIAEDVTKMTEALLMGAPTSTADQRRKSFELAALIKKGITPQELWKMSKEERVELGVGRKGLSNTEWKTFQRAFYTNPDFGGMGGVGTPGLTREMIAEQLPLLGRLRDIGEHLNEFGEGVRAAFQAVGVGESAMETLFPALVSTIEGGEAGLVEQLQSIAGIMRTAGDATNEATEFRKKDVIALQDLGRAFTEHSWLIDSLSAMLAETARNTAAMKAERQTRSTQAGTQAARAKMGDPCVESHVSLGIGGRKVAEVVARANLDLAERGGAKVTAWQKHRIIQSGAITVGA